MSSFEGMYFKRGLETKGRQPSYNHEMIKSKSG